MPTVRAFIAIDIPSFAREKIADLQNGFKTLGLDVAWVKPSNFHLTLKFLGNVNRDQISEIKKCLKTALAGVPCFSTSIGDVGVFPSLERPRVLWVGLENSDVLVSLQKKVDSGLAQIGFEPEPKMFSAHLTLGRIKSQKGKTRLQDALKNAQKVESEPIQISAVTLYESQLTREGSMYTVLEKFKLDAPAQSG